MPQLTSEDIALINRVFRLVRNISGPNVVNDGHSIRIGERPTRRQLPSGDDWLWVRLTSTATGAGIYNARQQKVVSGNNEDPTVDFLASNFFADANTSDDCLFRNLSESGSGSGAHALTADGSLYLLARRASTDTNDSPAKPVYEANVATVVVVAVKVGSNISAGKYNGTVYKGKPTESGSGALTLPDGMTAGQSVLLIVAEEDSAVVDGFANAPAAAQRIMNGSYAAGLVIGMSTEATPRPIVLITNGVGTMTGATTIDPTATQTTADSTTWTRALNGTPLNIYVQTRMIVDDAAMQIDIFQRQLSFDARGLCYRCGPEEKITVYTGGPCE